MRRALPLLALLSAAFVASASAAPAAAPQPPALRLPGDAVPRRGALDLTIRPAAPAYTGTVVYELELKKPLDLIWINANGLALSGAKLIVADKERRAAVVPGGEEFAGLALEEPAGPGLAKLEVSFAGTLAEKDTRGLFREKEGDDWYVYTQFEAVDARRAFPCFDEPSYKIPWRLRLHVPEGLTAVANTPQLSETPENDGMKVVAFADTKPLPSYLVALGVGPFDVVPAGKLGPTPLRVLTPRGQGSRARYAAKTIAPLLKLLEDYFAIPYPYEKLDALAVPTTVGFGAMENPGLITYSSGLILATPDEEGIQFHRRFADTAAHEMAHQWFGDLVTMAFWDDTWLNESFASWMADKTIERFAPEWETTTSRASARNNAMGADSLVTARRIRQPIATKDDIANAFDGITYGKGDAVLTMFESWMGQDAFRRGVQRYLKAHAYGNATAADFLSALAAEGHPEVPAAFSTFLDQPGVPELSVSLTCEPGRPGKLSFAQKRLLPIGSQPAAPQTWQIPACVRYGSGDTELRECTLVTRAVSELTLKGPGCPAWLLANAGEAGYYRPAYQGDLYAKLLAVAPKRLSPAERVGLVGDVSALAASGDASVSDALALAPAFAGDEDRQVTNALVQLVAGLKNRLSEDELPAFGRFVQKTFGARARSLGLSPKPGEDDDTRLVRPTLASLVAIYGKDEALRAQAVVLARKWLADRTAVGPDVAPAVLAIAADAGDASLFDVYLEAARKAKDRRERVMLLQLLGVFRAPGLEARALGVLLSPEFESRDTVGILWATMGDEQSRQEAWDFVKKHWDEVVARLPQQMRGYLPMVGAFFCDEAHRTEVENFVGPRVKGFEGAPRNLAQALERIRTCAAVRTAQAPGIREFLAKY